MPTFFVAMTEHTAIADAVTPVLHARGLDLYDVEVNGSGGARVVRVLVTTSSANRAVASISTRSRPPPRRSRRCSTRPSWPRSFPATYALEVSSPGLERPLRTPEHFRSALGEQVSVKRDGDRPTSAARSPTVDDDGIEMERPDGTTLRVPYDEITQARTVFEWGATADRGPARGKARR